MPKSADFIAAIHTSFRGAQIKKHKYLDINSGDLHRLLGYYPGPDHRMPLCCGAMRKEMKQGDQILNQPPKGNGASLTIRYQLPRP